MEIKDLFSFAWGKIEPQVESQVIQAADDRLVISCNHKDGEETITLEDVEPALAEAGFGSDLVSFAVPFNRLSHLG